ncbi:holo-ACP synthase [Natranaerofaba carboxydovora]|uniref:holo-ACP synthase n=1 Tax=Natranaerofaba carboxydovora TaxID=2742683 RepID=UPI001F139DC0|nr:holo-ACP synthase [Natranaerofaba carboxydovora]UMZ74894.1 Holo-[acyl-carrier-protein] synthase [Natranaerofaba carboxydovora]
MIIGTGVDMLEITRIKKMYEKRPGRTLEKIFGELEKEYILSKKNPYPHMAARFCAKEAFSKALGTGIGKMSLPEFQVVNDSKGKPEAIITGKANEILQELGGNSVHISLSHTKELAIAYVIIT